MPQVQVVLKVYCALVYMQAYDKHAKAMEVILAQACFFVCSWLAYFYNDERRMVMTKKIGKRRLDKIIGKNISRERKARKFTRDEFAKVMGLTVSHLGLIERGERGATATTLSKVSKAFDISIDYLFASPDGGGLSGLESDAGRAQSYRKKIQSLIKNLGEAELEFIIHAIRGVATMNGD